MDIMLDLETLSSAPDAAIVAIGATTFFPSGEQATRSTFYQIVDPSSSQRTGGRIDAKTVGWWMSQTVEARSIFWADGPVDIAVALDKFRQYCADLGDVYVWGNGADFDNVVLRSAFERSFIPAPWSFRNSRCYRTLKSLRPDVSCPFVGVKHNAFDDALSQAAHAEAIFAEMRRSAEGAA